MKSIRSSLALTVALLMLTMCWFAGLGCRPAPPMAKLAGQVTYEGAPLEEGLLVLSNPLLGVYITAKIADGRYEVKTAQKGVPPGEYKIAITPPLVDHPVGPILQPPKATPFAAIPSRYRDAKSSGFSVTLVDGDNQASFAMTK